MNEVTYDFEDINSLSSLVRFAETIDGILQVEIGSTNSILLNWSRIKFVEPAFLVAQAVLIQYLIVKHGKRVTINLPSGDHVRQYLANCRFMDRFLKPGTGYTPQPVADNIAISMFEDTDQPLIENLGNFCLRHLIPAPDQIHRIENSFAELMDNVGIHSGCPVGGCVMGQYYPKLHLIRIAICDLGISIPGHLSRHMSEPNPESDENIIAKAFEIGVTGSDTFRTGMGLEFVREFTMEIGGTMRVFSRRGSISITGKGMSRLATSEPFPGTLFTIDWPTDRG